MEDKKYYINFYTLVNKLGKELIENDGGKVKILDKDLSDLTARNGLDISYDKYILKIINMFIDNSNYDMSNGTRLNNNLYLKITKNPLNKIKLRKEENEIYLAENNVIISQHYTYEGVSLLELTNIQRYPLGLFGYGVSFRRYVSIPDVYRWGLSRIFPKDRVDSEKLLSEINLKSFSPNLIFKETKFKYFNDDFSIGGWNF